MDAMLIPVVPKLQPDELLYSWMSRIAKANGFDKLNDFFEAYVWPEYRGKKARHQRILCDIRHDLSAFCEALGGQCSPLKLVLNASLFCGVAPLMSRSRASQHIGMMARRGDEKNTLSSPNNMVSELLFCPQCRQEDLDTLGVFAFYRSHHMPGVTVCHKHGCELRRFLEGKSIDQCPLLEEKPDALAYARFCYEMLYSGLQCDFSAIKPLVPGIPMSPYVNQEEVLSQLLRQYSSVEEVIKRIPPVASGTEFLDRIDGRFALISPWREDVVELKCSACGREFVTTPYRILSGWGCPRCDGDYLDADLFQRLFDEQNDGTYTLLSPFNGMSNHVTVHHTACGRSWKMRARSFVIEHARCECEYMVSEAQARKAIEYSGEFVMESFISASNPVTIRHLNCGKSFEWNYHKFLRHPWCKVCNPRLSTKDIFIREIKELTGDDYTLEGEYVDRTTKVRIRHNRCNHSREYIPSHFLDGARCKKCTPEYTRTELERVVREVSLGKYVWAGSKTNNLEIALDTETGEEKYLSQQKILQELLRPTPSPILPLKERNLNVPLPTTQADTVLQWLRSHYEETELISLEDIEIDGFDYTTVKNATKTLVAKGDLIRVTPGIFSFSEEHFTPHEVMTHKYLIRNGNRIGFLTDHSFAYDLGLCSEKPDRIGIVTNQESQQHGRSRMFLGIDLKIHGSRVPVTNENYAILAVLTFLMSEKRLKCCTQGDKNEILKRWLQSKGVAYEAFEDYYPYFPPWARKMVAQIYEENAE